MKKHEPLTTGEIVLTGLIFLGCDFVVALLLFVFLSWVIQ